MDEDKISCDISDKRKVEDDSPKPNPKRIKLVRPVFSPVVKPTISTTTEINKCDIQPKELPKSTNSSDKLPNVVDDSQTPEQSMVLSETIKKPIVLPEAVKKPVVMPVVPEEQTDSSSDALDIINIFSEETKKELEHLKKNIFKIEDDGSSSENDSQPKRPRLKRPTFITSAIENKVEPNDSKILDKTNETQRLDLVKPVYEENINKNDEIIEKQFIADDKIDKPIEVYVENIKVNDVKHTNVVEKKMIITETIEKVLEPIVTENINRVVEDKFTKSISIDNLVEKETIERKSIDKVIEDKIIQVENLLKVPQKVVEIKDDDIKIKQNDIQIDTNIQEKTVEKDKSNKLVEEKHRAKDVINRTAGEQNIKTEALTKEITSKEKINETAAKNIDYKNTIGNVRVILERYICKQSNEIEPNKKPIQNFRLEDGKITVETINEKKNLIIKESSKHNKNNDEVKIETDIENIVTDTLKNIQVNKTGETNKIVTNLKNEKQKCNKNVQGENENKCSFDVLSKQLSSLDDNQKLDEHESQIFKSDILKAALMSKKSPESLVNLSEEHPEEHEQLEENIYSISETNKTEMLPKTGPEAIVSKIEVEIKHTTKDQPTNNKKSQSKISSNLLEINNSKEASSSVCINKNIIYKTDEPPKWGSAKMNEVEKFLNDSNVTITPICKSEDSPKLGKITLKLPKIGNPEIKSEATVRPDVKSELIKKITNKQIAMGESPLKSALSQPSKSFSDFATIRLAPKPSAEQIALLEQQILNTPKKRGRPSKALAQQKQLLLQYQQQQRQQPHQQLPHQQLPQQLPQQQLPQQQKVSENNTEDEAVFHVPLFDMEDMSGGVAMFDSFDTSTPKRGKSIRGKGSRGRRGKGGRSHGRDGSDSDTTSNSRRMDDEGATFNEEMNQEEETKQVAMMEAERLRKEEERERKMEARKRKLKERNDALKEKKMKKKQKAEERRLQWHEKKRQMQEEKAKAAEMKKSLPPPQNFDDETRMSADCNNSRSQTPARNFIMGMF